VPFSFFDNKKLKICSIAVVVVVVVANVVVVVKTVSDDCDTILRPFRYNFKQKLYHSKTTTSTT